MEEEREFELTCYVCWNFIDDTDNEEETKKIHYCTVCEGTTIKEQLFIKEDLLEDLLEDYKETKGDIADLREERKGLTDEEEIEDNESHLEFLGYVFKEQRNQIKLLQTQIRRLKRKL
ncbi:hypothetical protein [Bacillus cereus group sp. Bce015]|uniref:hypothetical protein n=1 Tax=Bacillus cereus group sp. Bce015 TaxID=3445249 RepID=UPI003F25B9A0